MRFVDLFAGLGGFHIALNRLGHECVFASEKKEVLANLYEHNFNIQVNRDITKIPVEEIPEFDILCAGFPCQPFSKAGDQKGLDDEKNGSLFDKIIEILDYHRPAYIILENVRNLESHNNGNTWKYIENELERHLGYSIDSKVLSPHKFDIPQHRERLFIVGAINDLENFSWPGEIDATNTIHDFLDTDNQNHRRLENEKIEVINLWQGFLNAIPAADKLPSFPIWSMEFGATYPFEEEIPFRSSSTALGKTRGAFGIPLKGMSRSKKFEHIPNYSRRNELDEHGNPVKFPTWKRHYIRSNRAFYEKYKETLEPIIDRIRNLEVSSWQKFEWNVQGGERDLNHYVVQFRGSGVRIKRPDYFPSLVTVSTQIPIIGWENRYISPQEGARIQCLGDIELPENIGTCFSALGNAVNSRLVELIAESLIPNDNIEEHPIPENDHPITRMAI